MYIYFQIQNLLLKIIFLIHDVNINIQKINNDEYLNTIIKATLKILLTIFYIRILILKGSKIILPY